MPHRSDNGWRHSLRARPPRSDHRPAGGVRRKHRHRLAPGQLFDDRGLCRRGFADVDVRSCHIGHPQDIASAKAGGARQARVPQHPALRHAPAARTGSTRLAGLGRGRGRPEMRLRSRQRRARAAKPPRPRPTPVPAGLPGPPAADSTRQGPSAPDPYRALRSAAPENSPSPKTAINLNITHLIPQIPVIDLPCAGRVCGRNRIAMPRSCIWTGRRPRARRKSMTDTPDIPRPDPAPVAETLRRAIGERYLTYALSTIMHRACPMRATA